MIGWKWIGETACRLGRDRSGAAFVEFAIAVPVLLSMYLGGYVLSDAVSCNRKVTSTARSETDLISQYATLAASQIDSLLNASTQIMAPYPSANAFIRVSQIAIDGNGIATISWSRAINSSGVQQPFVKNTIVTVPAGIGSPNSYLLLGEVSYGYVPIENYLLGPLILSESIYMVPRASSQVICNGC